MGRGLQVLITGGAGFVGSHLADALVPAGHRIVLFDNLEAQVHHALVNGRPEYLCTDYELIHGDIRDLQMLAPLVRQADVVFHLASVVGVGQSMYEVRRYTEVNVLGAANILQLLVDDPGRVRKIILASSMSVYGEGAYVCPQCGNVAPRQRAPEQLLARQWELRCPVCGEALSPVPTGEEKPLFPTSIYAITKRDQEELFLAFGRAYGIPVVALRFFNIYGSRQSLSNPYTGVAAIFSSRLLGGEPPILFEDGDQLRDFVHVRDVVQACLLAMANPAADHQVFNVGSGRPVSVREVADLLARELHWRGEPDITQQARAGDIRHCFADIRHIRQRLGYVPTVTFEAGVGELVHWVSQAHQVRGAVTKAMQQLKQRGLTR